MKEATAEQLDWFQKGAAARYAELGVKSEDAVRLFNQHLEKMATPFGYPGSNYNSRGVKLPEGQFIPQPLRPCNWYWSDGETI